jgi:hypothetical protein
MLDLGDVYEPWLHRDVVEVHGRDNLSTKGKGWMGIDDNIMTSDWTSDARATLMNGRMA